MNSHNFVRAENLTFFSIEFFALIAILIYAIFKSNKCLISTYVLFVPFTDKVYRFYDLQIADILGLIIILRMALLSKIKINYVHIFLFIMLVFGTYVGYYINDDLFSLLYSLRFCIVLLTSLAIAQAFNENPLVYDNVFRSYKFILVFSVAVGIVQAILWLSGLPVDGVFYTDYVRVKGLAHEPSTFAMWIILSLPLALRRMANTEGVIIDKFLVLVIVVGMALTTSAAAFLTAIVILFLVVFLNKEVSKSFKLKIMLAFLAIACLATFIFDEIIYNNIVLKIINYSHELLDPSLEDASGRGGDRYLFELFSDSPVTGIGAFRSSRVADMLANQGIDVYIPGSNFYITTIVEFGIVAGTLILIFLFFWILWILKRIQNRSKFVWGCTIIGWLIAISAMRIVSFHQPWLNIAFFVHKKK